MESKKENIWLILLALFLIALVGYFVYMDLTTSKEESQTSNTSSQSDQKEISNIENETSSSSAITTTFIGTYLTAKLPIGWSIIEYVDGENSDNLVDGVTYTGITGFAIMNDNNDIVFSSNGAYGIGGVSFCEEYYQFSDFNSSHYNDKVAINTEVGEATPIIVDLSTTVFSEFKVLGTPWRRIDNNFYWDEVAGPTYFEAACSGLEMVSAPFAGLSFDADGYEVTTYISRILLGANETVDLELLDGVLGSLEVL